MVEFRGDSTQQAKQDKAVQQYTCDSGKDMFLGRCVCNCQAYGNVLERHPSCNLNPGGREPLQLVSRPADKRRRFVVRVGSEVASEYGVGVKVDSMCKA